MKKVLIAILIIIVVAAIGLGIFWFFDRQQGGTGGIQVPSFGDLFPFGQAPETPVTTPSTPTQNPIIPGQNVVRRERMWRISRGPQSGAGLFQRGGETWVRFVDTATGNVYENKLGESLLTRVSNTTIPKIYETLWTPTGNGLVARYIGTGGAIQTMYARIVDRATSSTSTSTSPRETGDEDEMIQELQGTFLPPEIVDIALFGTTTRAFFIAKNSNGTASGFVANVDGTRSTRLFDSSLQEWVASWPTENSAVITTKPSSGVNGFSYIVSIRTGALQRLVGDIAGLSVLPAPNLSRVVYSESGLAGTSFGALAVADQARTPISTRTLPEKCTWSRDNETVVCAVPSSFPSATYPDDWYKGLVSFADTFSSIDTTSGRATSILDTEALRTLARTSNGADSLDAIHLMLDSAEKFLIFTNKKDSSLWAVRLVEGE